MDYAQRWATRREHLGELQAYLGMKPFGRPDYPSMARIAFNESIGTDRGEAIVDAMVVHLQQNSILLPSAAVLEKIALVARARARKQAYKELNAGVDYAVQEKLDALIRIADDEARTPLAWLREWPEAPVQKNLAGVVQRLQSVRAIGSGRTGNGVFTGPATRLSPARPQSSAPNTSTASIINGGLLPWWSSPERWKLS